MSRSVVFPVGKEADANAYLAFCNTHNPDTAPDASWWPPTMVDKHGQRVVGYLGPQGQWNGGNWPEPTGGVEARSAGVLADLVEMPEPID